MLYYLKAFLISNKCLDIFRSIGNISKSILKKETKETRPEQHGIRKVEKELCWNMDGGM